MPPLSQHQTTPVIKMLLLGASGTGKTSAIASLAEAGYNVRIIDFDNGIDILQALMLKRAPDKMDNIIAETFTDDYRPVGDTFHPVNPRAFSDGSRLLTQWRAGQGEEAYDLGAPGDWGPDCVLVIDSLYTMSRAAMALVKNLNNNADGRSHYREAQARIEGVLATVFSKRFNTNVIITSHIKEAEDETGQMQGLPASIGSALAPIIGRYFNTILLTRKSGSGTNERRVISTVSVGSVAAKHTLGPEGIDATLPNDTGLATFFEKVREQSARVSRSKVAQRALSAT